MVGRREFLRRIGLWMPAGALALGAWLQSCGDGGSSSDGDDDDDDDDDDDNGGSGGSACSASGDFNTEISSNHGHTVELTQAQVDDGDPVQLELTEGNTHTHTVDLSADDLTNIGNGDEVTVTSSLDGHTHDVTFNCTTTEGATAAAGLRLRYRIHPA